MKRFTETTRFEEAWYHALPLHYKMLFELIWAKADHAGVWSVNKDVAEYFIGKKIDLEDFLKATAGKVAKIDANRWWIVEFIRVNCGRLSDKCKPHAAVFDALAKHGIDPHFAGSALLDPKVFGSYPVATRDLQDTNKTIQETDNTAREPEKRKDRGDLEEVVGFCISLGLPPSDGEACFYKWQSNGWTNDKKPILDWRATIRSWKAARYLPSQKPGAQKTTTAAPREDRTEDPMERLVREALDEAERSAAR